MSSPSSGLVMEIVTPSYAPDFVVCAELNSSILRWTASDVVHTIIVPSQDTKRFSVLEGERTVIRDAAEFLPASMLKVPSANMWINAGRPWPPIRGWIAQQIIKLEATRRSSAKVVLLVDSDLVLLRKTSADIFLTDNVVTLFRRPDGIDETLPRHRLWVQNAQQLLGLPALAEYPLPDYICCPCAWSPVFVREMLARIEKVNGCRWETAIGRQLHFSEMILYGVYAEQVLQLEQVPVTEDMRCVNYFDEIPLFGERVHQFVNECDSGKIAAMISAKSATDLSVRREVVSRLEAVAEG